MHYLGTALAIQIAGAETLICEATRLEEFLKELNHRMFIDRARSKSAWCSQQLAGGFSAKLLHISSYSVAIVSRLSVKVSAPYKPRTVVD